MCVSVMRNKRLERKGGKEEGREGQHLSGIEGGERREEESREGREDGSSCE